MAGLGLSIRVTRAATVNRQRYERDAVLSKPVVKGGRIIGRRNVRELQMSSAYSDLNKAGTDVRHAVVSGSSRVTCRSRSRCSYRRSVYAY